MRIGDYVVHNTFPPAEGYVIGCEVLNTSPESYKVCVKLSDGRLYWDMLSTWSVVEDSSTGTVVDNEFIPYDIV